MKMCNFTIIIFLLVAACAPIKQQTVWDMYDVRYPVPASSGVPSPKGQAYDRYMDNDAFYRQPTFGMCNGGINCE